MPEPIKVQAYDKFPYKLVEWKLHDKCNYNCPFCGDENKLGKVGWNDFETNKAIVDSIVDSANGEPVWIQITGGEPTLYPKFIELVSYAKQRGAYVSVISNGSRTIRWWKELREANVLDLLYITFHSQHPADYQHIAEVSNLFLDAETIIISVSTYMVDSIDYALDGVDYLTENTGNFVSMNAMDLLSDPITPESIGQNRFDKILTRFNTAVGKRFEQEKKKTSIPRELIPLRLNATITYDDGSAESKDVTQMMKLGENRFKDWICSAGMDSMNIENGVKYRGGCKRDATPFEAGNLKFFDKPFKCDVDDCYCAMDMIATKLRNLD